MSYDYAYKIITIGDSGIGKTTCIEQYVNRTFSTSHMATIGVEYFSKIIEIPNITPSLNKSAFTKVSKIQETGIEFKISENPIQDIHNCHNGHNDHNNQNVIIPEQSITSSTKQIKIQIWDTAGQELFRSIVRTYYKSVVGVMLFFDTTDLLSFRNLRTWMDLLKQEVSCEPVYCLIGTKIDLSSRRTVSYELAKNFANMNGMSYFEISCLPQNRSLSEIDSAFHDLTVKIYQKYPVIDTNNQVSGITLPIVPLINTKPLDRNTCCIVM